MCRLLVIDESSVGLIYRCTQCETEFTYFAFSTRNIPLELKNPLRERPEYCPSCGDEVEPSL